VNANVNEFNLQKRLNDFHTWSDVWQLRISYKKCAVLPINYPLNEPYGALMVGENELNMVDDIKDLGIIMDSKLKFTLHINCRIVKAFDRFYLILKCFLSKDVETLIRAFIVYVRPTLEYASGV
jgi:hypothetical protein